MLGAWAEKVVNQFTSGHQFIFQEGIHKPLNENLGFVKILCFLSQLSKDCLIDRREIKVAHPGKVGLESFLQSHNIQQIAGHQPAVRARGLSQPLLGDENHEAELESLLGGLGCHLVTVLSRLGLDNNNPPKKSKVDFAIFWEGYFL